MAFVILLGVLVSIDEPQPRVEVGPPSHSPVRAAFPFVAAGLIYAIALVSVGR